MTGAASAEVVEPGWGTPSSARNASPGASVFSGAGGASSRRARAMSGLVSGRALGASFLIWIFSRYQPVVIDRMLLRKPWVKTMKTWPNTKKRKPNARMKWIARAVRDVHRSFLLMFRIFPEARLLHHLNRCRVTLALLSQGLSPVPLCMGTDREIFRIQFRLAQAIGWCALRRQLGRANFG